MKGASVLRLEGIVTEKAHLSILDSISQMSSGETLQIEFQLSRDMRLPSGQTIADAREVQVVLGCMLNGANEAEARANGYPLWARVEVVGTFNVEEVPVPEREQMLSVNAVAIIFPYLRASLSALSSMCGIPAVTLPVFNVAAVFSDDDTALDSNND